MQIKRRPTKLNFSELLIDDVIRFFNLKQNQSLVVKTLPATHNQIEASRILASRAIQRIQYWNEQELVMKHLSFILKDVNFEDDRYSLFAERPISATIDNILLTGIVDFVVAEGIGRPYAPYFFIQEYKYARQGPESDPQAQLLGEMLVAQEINQNKQPVY